MIKETIVVEGHHDELRIKKIYPDTFVIITNGSQISNETIELIKRASNKTGVILFLDPDYPGRKIEKTITEHITNYKVAYIRREKAFSHNRKKIGVEHATDNDIIEALKNVVTFKDKKENQLNLIDLLELGLSGSCSLKNRDKVAKALQIPLFNTKTLLKVINAMGLNKGDLEKILAE